MERAELKLGVKINELSPKKVSITRVTLESCVDVLLEEEKRREYKIQTGNKFFNHLLTGMASRACLNLDILYQPTSAETLEHVVVEDVGLTLGRAVRKMLDARIPEGVAGRGSHTVAFDEALICVTLAFDGRSYTFFRGEVPGLKHENVEGVSSSTLCQFFEGFAQGAGCTVQIQAIAGEDGHHTWEATFKAFGEALRESLASCSYRAGATIGLKGTGMEKKV